MTFFSSLPDNAGARDIFKLNREAGKAMIDYHTAVLRQPSALTEGERELIAGYVSALNNCSYCAGVHTRVAEAFGLPAGLVEKMVQNLDISGVEERLLPLLRYARKLTQTPWKMVKADAEAVFAAGWDEQALHDAIHVIALYNFMNRLISGHGIEGNPRLWAERANALREGRYGPLKKTLEKE